jgi:phosphoglycolate phosphatase
VANPKDLPLLLFDIDGTLVRIGNRVVAAGFWHAMRTVFRIEREELGIDGSDFSGMIDRQILAEMARRRNRVATAEELASACLAMAAYCREAVLEAEALPGVVGLLEMLDERGYPLGILSGNVQDIGWQKLEAAVLRGHFRFGAFGDDADLRHELVPIALERARETLGREFRPEQVYVIGDTPRDVACARAGGSKVIAVATGRWSLEELAAHGPDHLLADLSDAPAFLRLLPPASEGDY